jgi:phosphoribosyl 1,2-cyclic phosphodiesterase
MDHWEGLKDAEWFWTNGNGLRLSVFGAEEAIDTVRRGYGHPAYVPLEVLAARTLRGLSFSTLGVGETVRIHGWRIQTHALNHYSGGRTRKNPVDTLGYRMRSPQGLVVAYLCDHEPSPATAEDEERMLEGAHLAVIDAHFADRVEHAFGHGSQEHAAWLASRHPGTLVLAAHHGPANQDRDIRRAHARHGKGLRNYAVAEEGMRLNWNPHTRRFGSRRARIPG